MGMSYLHMSSCLTCIPHARKSTQIKKLGIEVTGRELQVRNRGLSQSLNASLGFVLPPGLGRRALLLLLLNSLSLAHASIMIEQKGCRELGTWHSSILQNLGLAIRGCMNRHVLLVCNVHLLLFLLGLSFGLPLCFGLAVGLGILFRIQLRLCFIRLAVGLGILFRLLLCFRLVVGLRLSFGLPVCFGLAVGLGLSFGTELS